MLVVLVPTKEVRASGRLDFGFFNPLAEDQISLSEGYRRVKLSEVCVSLKTGKTAPRGGYTESGVRIVKVKNIRGNGIDWTEEFFVSEEFYTKAKKKASVVTNDILMLCSAHAAHYIGRCDIVLDLPKDVLINDGRCLTVGELIIIRPDPEKVSPEYLLSFLRLSVTQEKIQRLVKGQSAHLYPVDLGDIDVVLPPRELQEDIAEMNRSAESAYRNATIRAQDDLQATKRLIRQVIFGESVAGDTVADEAVPHVEVEEEESTPGRTLFDSVS